MLLALFAAFSFGAIVQVAVAKHWHFYNGVDHGIVHGQATGDGSFFGRTISNWMNQYVYCGVGDYDRGLYASGWTYGPSTCSLWSWHVTDYVNECRGLSWNAVSNFVNQHYHEAHNYDGGPEDDCPARRV